MSQQDPLRDALDDLRIRPTFQEIARFAALAADKGVLTKDGQEACVKCFEKFHELDEIFATRRTKQ